MRPRSLVPLLVLLLLAGCVEEGHGHAVDAHGDRPTVIVGVENTGSRDLLVEVTLTAPNGTVVWNVTFEAKAGALPERHHTLEAEGIYTLDVAYSWREGDRTATGSERERIDTSECPVVTHLTFTVDGTDGIEKGDTHRECH